MENSKELGKKKISNEDLEKTVGGMSEDELKKYFEDYFWKGEPFRVRYIGPNAGPDEPLPGPHHGECGTVIKVIERAYITHARVDFDICGPYAVHPNELEKA